MQIAFLKMHGLGNDFMIVDRRHADDNDALTFEPALIRRWSARHTGIGFDQLLTIEPPRDADTIAYYRIFNADGEPVEQCGNGVRCVAAAIAREDGLHGRHVLALGSPGGRVEATINEDQSVTVEMTRPNFEPDALPMLGAQRAPRYTVDVDGERWSFFAVSVGNPHVVLLVDDVETAPVDRIGPALCQHALFPRGVNVGFAEVVSRNQVRLRVFERGVGETRACGTGACAAMVCLRGAGLVDDNVEIALPGGALVINWRATDHPVVMTGPASLSYEGCTEL